MIVVTINFMIITKLIEIAVKYTKLTLMIFFFSFLPRPGYNSYLLSALGYVFVLKNFCFKMHLRDLGIKMSSMVLLVQKKKKSLHKMTMLLHLHAFRVTQKFLVGLFL